MENKARAIDPSCTSDFVRRLNAGERNLLRLIRKATQSGEEWARVSPDVFLLVKALPVELAVVVQDEDGSGRAKLTPRGQDVEAWL